jgi:cobalt transporter subunit CbtB
VTQTKYADQTAAVHNETAKYMQAGLAAILGIGLFMLVTFSHPSILHNAAHDARHGITVPCH